MLRVLKPVDCLKTFKLYDFDNPKLFFPTQVTREIYNMATNGDGDWSIADAHKVFADLGLPITTFVVDVSGFNQKY